MRWNLKTAPKPQMTNYSLMLVAFPELERTPFRTWLRSTLGFLFAPVRRGIENLLSDGSDVARGIFKRRH